ncbi:MAG: metallophosphatase family protein [Coriobacteriales bacterium]|jgi:putative phosphoesterase|nr:metallophosphatase family protein [Coriobacteriales bacterium]
MKFGIISDTHGSLPAAVHTAFAGVEHIIHAGDIGGQCILEELELIAPVTAVTGNNDYFEDYLTVAQSVRITLDGTRFFITHTPERALRSLRGYGDIPAGGPLPHVCIHGHTHTPRDEYAGVVRMLCPGSPVRPRNSGPTVLILEATNGQVHSLDFVRT